MDARRLRLVEPRSAVGVVAHYKQRHTEKSDASTMSILLQYTLDGCNHSYTTHLLQPCDVLSYVPNRGDLPGFKAVTLTLKTGLRRFYSDKTLTIPCLPVHVRRRLTQQRR